MPKTHVPAAGEAMPAAKPTIFLALTPSLRTTLATTIENLIALLDTIDGDENLEETGDEQDTSATDRWGVVEREVVREEDDEGYLGQPSHYTDAGLLHDLEADDCDKEGDDADREADDAETGFPGYVWGGNESDKVVPIDVGRRA